MVVMNENDDQVLSSIHSHQGVLFLKKKTGQNYPHWRHSKEVLGYKPNPRAYGSDN